MEVVTNKGSSPVSALKALGNQYKELQDHPLNGITAQPANDSNIKIWCGNVFFPKTSPFGEELIVHFTLTFDDMYPSSSPLLALGTDINHTHVFFPRCCFSLLPDFRSYFESTKVHSSAYWNPTRTVRSFLEAFYNFLVFDVDRESHGKGNLTELNISSAIKSAKELKCPTCGHTYTKPIPVKPNITEDEANKYNDDKMGKGEVLTEIDQAAADLNCSVSGRKITDTIMGFGVAVSTSGKGLSITTDMYPISYESFYVDKTKISAGGQPITHFIPFVLNQEHWKSKRI